MPKCRDCEHWQIKSLSVNYECKLGHNTPDYGDTDSCSSWEEKHVLFMEKGWSDKKNKDIYSDKGCSKEDFEKHDKLYSSSNCSESSSAGSGCVVIVLSIILIYITAWGVQSVYDGGSFWNGVENGLLFVIAIVGIIGFLAVSGG